MVKFDWDRTTLVKVGVCSLIHIQRLCEKTSIKSVRCTSVVMYMPVVSGASVIIMVPASIKCMIAIFDVCIGNVSVTYNMKVIFKHVM